MTRPSSVDSFIDGEHLKRPIFWIQESFHHIPRDEDEPIMNEHWSGIEVVPRVPSRQIL
jgi:primary-amine oxidase